MKCRYCASTDSKVIDSRPTEDGSAIRRRRECNNCGKRFTTYEKIEEIPIMVVKRDGRREQFDSEKIRSGIRKACEKRPISAEVQDKMVDDVTREIFNSLAGEVTTMDIGEIVMHHLKDVHILEMVHDNLADVHGGHFPGQAIEYFPGHIVHHLVLHLGGNGALFAGLPDAGANLLAVELLPAAVPLDHHDGNLLYLFIGGKPLAAVVAFPAPANGAAVLCGSAVDDFTVCAGAVSAFHREAPSST